jgi:GT2 family glycosyltransferase
MLEHAVRPEVGAVGAKLYFPDETVQHGGVVLGIGGVCSHFHLHFARKSTGYHNRLMTIQDMSAVTGACMMFRKEVFEEVGGFDEKFRVALNDVDLCLRIRERGYSIIWTPHAELYHHEQKTRGRDDTPAKKTLFNSEMHRFISKWWDLLQKGDPFFHPEFFLGTPNFTLRA